MPSNWLYVDTNFPSFTGKETVNEKIDTIQSYLYVLLEQLRYCLHNLDTSNMNQIELNKYVNGITDPVYKRLEDDEGNITQLQLTAKGLDLRITNAEGDINQLDITAKGLSAEISNAKGDITKLQATAQGLAAQISNAAGDITKLQATAKGFNILIGNASGDTTQIDASAAALRTQISNTEKGLSTLEQTVKGFRLSVTNGTSSSTLELWAGGTRLSSEKIQINGEVTFNSLSQSGSTVINGDNITTGTVLSQYIKLMGLLTVHDENSVPWGVLGHMKGLAIPDPGGPIYSTDGIGFASTSPDLSQVYGVCMATNAGVRMSFGNAAVIVINGAVELRAGSTCLRVWDNGNVTINNVPLSV